MALDFNHNLHQKVTYLGKDPTLTRNPLYVVIKSEYPNMYVMKPDEELVIHITNKFGQVIHNEHPHIRDLYKVKKSEISFEGDLFRPNDWL